VVDDVSSAEQLTVTVYVRPRAGHPELREPDGGSLLAPDPLSDEDFAAAYGADPADIDKVVKFAKPPKLKVTNSDPLKRSVTLQGDAAALQSAFGVQLKRYRLGAGRGEGLAHRGNVAGRSRATTAPLTRGCIALRAVLANPLTSSADIDAVLDEQVRLGDALSTDDHRPMDHRR
jgi:hypothetical protein